MTSVIVIGYWYFLSSTTISTGGGGNNGNGSMRGGDGGGRRGAAAVYHGKRPIATIGYAITVSGCPKSGSIGDFGAGISDGAAVLKHSIHLNSIRNYPHSKSMYDYKIYALVHRDAES